MGKPKRHLWARVADGARRDYATFEQLYEDPLFDAFVGMSMASTDGCPDRFPPDLQRLTIEWCGVRELTAPLPASLRELHMPHNRLEAVPRALAACVDLETLDLTDNFIRVVDWVPPSVVTLDLSYNQVYAQDWAVFPATLAHLNVSYNFLTDPPPPDFEGQLDVSHNNFAVRRAVQPASPRPRRPPPVRPLYTNAQNVHSSAVQQSVCDAVAALHAAAAAAPAGPTDWQAELTAALDARAGERGRRACCWARAAPPRSETSELVDRWCVDATVHTRHSITLRELLRLVWRVVRSHTSRDELLAVLADEIHAGAHLCFTGRFSRVLNTLTGFVDGVAVQISDAEQLQGRIAALWHRLGDAPTPDAVTGAVIEVLGLLDEACVWDEAAWLAPFAALQR